MEFIIKTLNLKTTDSVRKTITLTDAAYEALVKKARDHDVCVEEMLEHLNKHWKKA